MEMLLMVACMSLLATAVMAAAFGAATRSEPPVQDVKPVLEAAAAQPPARFFKDYVVSPAVTQVPIEALLLQIENHVRLEQAAAESFVEMPTSALLHCKTISPLVQ